MTTGDNHSKGPSRDALIGAAATIMAALIGLFVICRDGSSDDGGVITRLTPETGPTVSPLDRSADSPAEPSSSTAKDEIRIFPGIDTQAKADSALVAQREIKGLRRLEPLETGLPVSEMPNGTSFLVPSTSLLYNSPDEWESDFGGPSGLRYVIHKVEGGRLFLFCFSTLETATQMAREDRRPMEATVASIPWRGFTTLVEIPVSRIQEVKRVRNIPDEELIMVEVLDVIVD